MVAAIISEGKPWAIWKTVTPEGWGLTEVVPSGYGSVEDQIFSAKNYFLSYFAGFSATSQQWRVRGMVSSSWSFTFSKRPFCQVALLLLIIFFKSWGKELNQFRPPSSSNGLCLLFCLYFWAVFSIYFMSPWHARKFFVWKIVNLIFLQAFQDS